MQVHVREFTDPGCPFAFSAEPAIWRLRWLYGDQLDWETRMVVLSESPEEYDRKGITVEKLSAGLRDLQQRYGMPIDWRMRPRMQGTAAACRAVVAARLHAPDREWRLLRALRVRAMAGALLDEQTDDLQLRPRCRDRPARPRALAGRPGRRGCTARGHPLRAPSIERVAGPDPQACPDA